MANHLPLEKKVLILSQLVEGSSVRSIERVTGVHRDTILRLMVSVGELAQDFMDSRLMGLKPSRLQVDEIWAYVGKKQKRVRVDDDPDMGDQYVFVAMDADTKLVPTWSVGKRTGEMARSFFNDLAPRINGRFQLSTDSFPGYYDAVDGVWGTEIDYAQIHKQYAEAPDRERRYSPARIIRVDILPLIGNPKKKHISTSYIERQNLTMRMQMRRFTRLTNAFSKKLENLKAAVALHFFYYNFIRVHQSLRVTPAMEARVANHIYTWEELLRVSAQKKAA